MRLKNMQIDEVSLVDKAANRCVFSFVKRDEQMTDAEKAKFELDLRTKIEAEIKTKLEAEAKTLADAKAAAEAKEAERKAAEIKAAEDAAAKALKEKELEEAKELEELTALAVQVNELIEKV